VKRIKGVFMKRILAGLFSFVTLVSVSVHADTDISGLQKLRSVKPVLSDILYRGGGPGGKRLLPETALNSLCKAGFSSAIYVYDDMRPSGQPIQCQDASGKSNQLKYHTTSFKDIRSILTEVRTAITSNSGPVYVHCWNGWHASGEVSAKALIQFCGWSGAEAAKYWGENIGDQGNLPKYRSIQNRISQFKAFDDLKIDAQTQAQICPKH
jgi:hypothetical protein